MGRTVLVIANPSAGLTPAGEAGERAATLLAGTGLRVEYHRTTGPGDAERAAREASRGFDLIVAAGGDGTVHEVANGLACSETPMGVVPLGSMNILAREIGVPLNVERACSWIASAEPAPMTLGVRDGRYFVLMAGIGYDAFALGRAIERAKRVGRKVNFLDYTLAAFEAAFTYRFPRIELRTSDGSTCSGAFALVANCARYGGNLRIARDARLDDPFLDLVLFPSGTPLALALYFTCVALGSPAAPRHVIYKKIEKVTITARGSDRAGESVPCQLDGELSEPLPASIAAATGALLVLRTTREC